MEGYQKYSTQYISTYLVGPFVPPWGIIYQLVELQAASLSFSNITVYNSPFEPVEYF